MKLNIPAQIALAFTFMWIAGEVFQSPHNQNLYFSICMTVGYAIWLGAHQIAYKKIRKMLHV